MNAEAAGSGGILQKYREAVMLKHGWEEDLSCPECGYHGRPSVNGWQPGYSMSFGGKPTIYSNVSCPECGLDLRQQAGQRLTELFSDVGIPGGNSRVFLYPGLFCIGVLALLAAAIAHWGWMAGVLFPAVFFTFFFPALLMFNYSVSRMRTRCECGDPDYVFMGMLGRSYCFRCSNCGRLLRLRD